MKIIIAGGGVSGLIAAAKLSEAGHEVALCGKSSSSARHGGADVLPQFVPSGAKTECSVNPTVVSTDGKQLARLIRPYGDVKTRIGYSELKRVLKNGVRGAEIIEGATVSKVMERNGRIVGAETADGFGHRRNMFCDLLVDACGAESKLRAQLADKGVSDVKSEEFNYLYTKTFTPSEDKPKCKDAYFFGFGEGICRLTFSENGAAEVRVLCKTKCGDEKIDAAVNALRSARAFGRRQTGASSSVVPLRRPLSVFVADGYAAIGDSACFTSPFLTRSVENIFTAADILAQTLNKNPSADVSNLWNYEYGVFKAFGEENCGEEVLKNAFSGIDPFYKEWIFGSKMLSRGDLRALYMGKMPDFPVSERGKKFWAGLDYPNIYARFKRAAALSRRAEKAAAEIPSVYDAEKVTRFAAKLDRFYLYIK
jgi:flavin-dependent dehydrogenase